VFISGFVAMQN